MTIVKKATEKKVKELAKELSELKSKLTSSSEKVTVLRIIKEKGIFYLVECSVNENQLTPEDKIKLGDEYDEVDFYIGKYFVEHLDEII